MSTTTELKPCPFCGSQAHMVFSQDGDDARIMCDNWKPGVCLGSGPWADTRGKALAAWNRRSAAHGEPSNAPECQDCGDGIMAHDPGVCGNCYAMKYRDLAATAQAAQSEDARDAARYRHVRDNIRDLHAAVFRGATPLMYKGSRLPLASEIDAAIDAAMSTTPRGK